MMLKHSIRIYPQVVGRIVVLVVLTLGFVQALCHVAASFDDTGHVTIAGEVAEHSGVTRDFEVSGDTGASWSAGYAGHSEGAGDSGAAGHTEIAGRSEGTGLGTLRLLGILKPRTIPGLPHVVLKLRTTSGISGHSGVAGHSGNTDAPRCDQGSGEHCGPSDLATSCSSFFSLPQVCSCPHSHGRTPGLCAVKTPSPLLLLSRCTPPPTSTHGY